MATDIEYLVTKAELAFPAAVLKDLTNFDGAGTTVVANLMNYAAECAIGDFEGTSRLDFDQTDYEHVKICVDLMRLNLKKNTGFYSDKDTTEYASLMDRLESKRITNTSTSQFESFNSQTTGTFKGSDFDDFRVKSQP